MVQACSKPQIDPPMILYALDVQVNACPAKLPPPSLGMNGIRPNTCSLGTNSQTEHEAETMAILSPVPFLSCCLFPRLPSLAYPLALTCPLNSDLFAQALYTRKLERLRVGYPCFLPPPVAPPSSPPAFALASPRSSTSLLALQVLFCSVHGLGNPERHTDGRGVLVYMSFTCCRPLPRLLLPSSPLSQPGMLRSSFGHQGGRLEGGG